MKNGWAPDLGGRDRPLYLAIADAIADDLNAEKLAPGDRLPPQRQLAQRLGVDFTTVSRAYAEAGRRGLVEARVGQGTFVSAANLPPTAPIIRGPVLERPTKPAPERAGPLDMTMNQPPIPQNPAALDRLRRVAAAAVAGLSAAELLHYPAADSPSAQAGLAAGTAWLGRRLGTAPAADRLLVAPGAQGAMAALLGALTQPGDTVCAEALTYPGFKAAAAQLGLRLVGVPMTLDAPDGGGVDPDALRRAFAQERPKLFYCMPTLHNPATATWSAERRAAVTAAAREYGVAILEDDIYGLLPPDAPPPLATLAPERVYLIGSLAKCVSPAARVAYVLCPDAKTAARAAAVQRGLSLSAAPLSVAVASAWIADGAADAMLAAVREEAAARSALAAQMLPAESALIRPEAFHVWLRLPAGWPQGEFAAILRGRGVLAAPADAFAATAEIPAALRLCLGAPADRADLARMLTIVAETLALPSSCAGVI